MATEKQIAANRANAKKSSGPRTEAGKQRSRLNAVRHGLTGQVVVLPQEDIEAYNKFTADIIATFETANPLEAQLAHSYASYQWRINRAAAIENNMFTLGLMEEMAENFGIENSEIHNAASNAKTFRVDAYEFDRLCMYNQRLVHQAEKVLKQLKELLAERKQREQAEMPEAMVLYNAYRRQNSTFDPKSVGFVLTIDQIKAQVRRQSLKNPAHFVQTLKNAA